MVNNIHKIHFRNNLRAHSICYFMQIDLGINLAVSTLLRVLCMGRLLNMKMALMHLQENIPTRKYMRILLF